MNAVEATRARFRPDRIATLFVGESAPVSGDFFYYGNSAMLTHMRSAVELALGTDGNFLERFKAYGWYLDDLVLTPVNHLTKAQRRAQCLDAQKSLADRITAYQPEAIVSLLMVIEPFVDAAAIKAGSNAPRYAVPFPGMGQQARFQVAMARIIPELPRLSDSAHGSDAMSTSRRIREIVGLTRQRRIADAVAWYALAKSFHAAAKVLDEFRDRIPSDTRPFAFNAALSLELIFKAILAQKQLPIPSGHKGHDLRVLCTQARVDVSDQQMTTLELMTEEIIWAARYPAPNTEERMDDYHDRIFEKHVVRSRAANVTSARANPETFPNWENYAKIWDVSTAEYGSDKDRQ
jgi:HEPN domain-containing protein